MGWTGCRGGLPLLDKGSLLPVSSSLIAPQFSLLSRLGNWLRSAAMVAEEYLESALPSFEPAPVLPHGAASAEPAII